MFERIVEKNIKLKLLSPCSRCKNKFGNDIGCKAFPKKIPDEILLGKNQHIQPLKNQGNNFVFKVK